MKRKGKCVGKVPFKTWNRAEKTAKKYFLAENKHLSVYECPNCLDFHLTSKMEPCNLAHLHNAWARKDIASKWAEFCYLMPGKKKAKRLRYKRNKAQRQREQSQKAFDERPRQPTAKQLNTLPIEIQRQKLADLAKKREVIAKEPNLWINCINWIRG